jgi:signal transduction histidine kinase
MIEDSEEDAELIIRELRRVYQPLRAERVDDSESLRAALDQSTWDVLLSDWSLPGFTAPGALQVLKESALDIPFIIVSGTVGETAAVDAMLTGASDYIVKGRLARLIPAIERELREHEDRRARRQAEYTLARTEKLRALGQMAAGISHDLTNILNPLSLHLQIGGRAIDEGDPAKAREALAEMKQLLTRGVQTLERLRDYSRQSPESRPETIDLNHLVHEASEIAKPRMTGRSGRFTAFREELGSPEPFPGQPADILSALVNLIVNAIDALIKGGTITLRTGSCDGESWVEVADNGPGMPPEVERRVFEPFFSTKGDQGTGLGLAMVYACMQRHGGSVRLKTKPGEGTSFTLAFSHRASVPPPAALAFIHR